MGQKRRLSVATALSSKADIILLDEPTFGLDSHNTFQLIELFQESVLVVKPSLWLHTTGNHSSLSNTSFNRKITNSLKRKVNHMFERWKKHYSFVDDVNIITKLLLGVAHFHYICP